ncbi:hypothetical protein SCLCIDRAFT_1083426 [Scleroderma citrinum Foug A]|uniref:Uncharacterized protein n=1 Tax=Scleroderma citrinum Foug A TaxID=1036808 RepID=A0A0C3A1J5_9AGAM|nr:hypothetical protein SCLCIDRAFT_1083426 [Scleroderma citrinum Foug A]
MIHTDFCHLPWPFIQYRKLEWLVSISGIRAALPCPEHTNNKGGVFGRKDNFLRQDANFIVSFHANRHPLRTRRLPARTSKRCKLYPPQSQRNPHSETS